MEIKRIYHNSIKIKTNNNEIIYIDPYKINNTTDKADIILISHEHFDHLSEKDIDLIIKQDTKIIMPESCKGKLNKQNIIYMKPMQEKTIDNIKILAVPAYNTDKEFHPKTKEWLGFIITLENKTVYYAGDTDLIPEMNTFPQIDLAILPVSGKYVMDAEEAANATQIIQPRIAMPCHYNAIIGTEEDAIKFKNKAHCKVVFDKIKL